MTEHLFYAAAILLAITILWKEGTVIKVAIENLLHPNNKVEATSIIAAHFGGVMPALVIFVLTGLIHGIYG